MFQERLLKCEFSQSMVQALNSAIITKMPNEGKNGGSINVGDVELNFVESKPPLLQHLRSRMACIADYKEVFCSGRHSLESYR